MALRTVTLIFFFISVGATAVEWEILPGECLVATATEYCESQVSVSVKPSTDDYPCLMINDKAMGCFSAARPVMRFNLRIDADVKFTATSQSGKHLATYTLAHKVIDTSPKRRRVRLPWSVF